MADGVSIFTLYALYIPMIHETLTLGSSLLFISQTAMERPPFPTETLMKANTSSINATEKAFTSGTMAVSTMETLAKTNDMVRVALIGPMALCIRASFRTVRDKAMASIPLVTEVNIPVVGKMAGTMDTEPACGKMDVNIKANGRMAWPMAKVWNPIPTVKSDMMACGLKTNPSRMIMAMEMSTRKFMCRNLI